MGAIGAGAAFFLLGRSDDAAAPATTTAAPATTAAAPATTAAAAATNTNLFANSTGELQAEFPAGWVVVGSFSSGDANQPMLTGRPTAFVSAFDAGALTVGLDVRDEATVALVLDEDTNLFSGPCPTVGARESLTLGGIAVERQIFSGCSSNPNAAIHSVAWPVNGGVAALSAVVVGDDSFIPRAIETFGAPGTTEANLTELFPCMASLPSSDGAFTTRFTVVNYTGTPITTSIQPAEAGAAPLADTIEPGKTASQNVNAGAVLTVNGQTHTATGGTVECVMVQPGGLVTANLPG